MSYILEALRKSEHERRQGQPVAGYEPVPMMPSRHSQSRWPIWLGVVLLLNAAVLGYVLWSGQQTSEPGEGPAMAETVPRPEPAASRPAPEPQLEPEPIAVERVPEPPPEPVAATPPREAPAPGPSSDGAPAQAAAPAQPPAVAEGGGAAGGAADGDNVPLLSELPQSFQRRVPDLVFNSHIYSSSPASRRVMINQRNLAEGDRLNNLVVETITPAGVILRLDGQSFEIAVVRNWTQPR